MIKLLLRNVRTAIEASPAEQQILTEWLSVQHPTPWFNCLYRQKLWDGVHRFYNNGGWKPFALPRVLLGHPQTIPTGLVPEVLRAAREINLPLRLEDYRGEPPVAQAHDLQGIQLRDYQEAAVDAVLKPELVPGFPWPRGIIEIPTRGGKTAVAAALAKAYRRELVLMMVPSRELLHQTAEELRTMLGEEIGIIGDGHISIQRVTVATAAMFYSRLEELAAYRQKVRVLLIDECHHLSGDSWQDIATYVPAYVRIGFSATPYRKDPVQPYMVSALTGDVLYRVAPQTLIARQIVTPVQIHYTLIDRPMSVVDEHGEWHASWNLPWLRRRNDPAWQPLAYQTLIVRNAYRNEKVAEFCEASQDPTLVIVNLKEHGEILAQRLGCTFVTGEEPMTIRRRILADMNTGRIRHLIATPIYDEGLTMPKIRRLSLAAAMKSHVKFIQRIGRGMQAEQGKAVLIAQDFLDAVNQHTYEHSEQRVRTAAQAGYEKR